MKLKDRSSYKKGEKETRANGHMTKKRFSEMRVKLGQKSKTDTGKDAAVVAEPKVNPINYPYGKV